MADDGERRTSLFIPRWIMIAPALMVTLLAGAVMWAWLSAPATVTLDILQPVGKTVVCHLVVDGRPESRQGVAPVNYRFETNELRFAVICLDPIPPADVTVAIGDRSGTGGNATAAGVTGVYQAPWWGTSFQMGSMTPTHVQNMRRSVQEETREDSEPPIGGTGNPR